MGRRALLIATDSYRDTRLQALQAPLREAEQLRDLLRDRDVGSFDAVDLLANESKAEAERAIERLFRDAGPGDTVLLYLSCHGIVDAGGQLYFAVGNTEFDLPMSTAIPAVYLHRLVESHEADAKIILLDCCYSGAIVRERTARGGETVDLPGKLLAGRGTYYMAASNAVQPAYELGDPADPAQPVRSLFTSAIVAGLATGAADLERDGRITPDELYRYVNREVRQRTSAQNPVGDGSVEGEIYVAWARTGRRAHPGTAQIGDTLIVGDLLAGGPGEFPGPSPDAPAPDGSSPHGGLAVPIGRAYRPGDDNGDPVWLDFANGSGHLLVVGRLASGKSVLLSTLISALALTHHPNDIALYALEAASNRLGAMSALPHVREVAGDDEPDQVDTILTTVEAIISARRRMFRAYGIDTVASYRAWRPLDENFHDQDHADVFLLVDGWHVFGRSEPFTERVRQIASTGPGYGVHLVVTSRWWDAVPVELAYMLQSHVELRLDDPSTSRMDPDAARQLPEDKSGWALHYGRRFQVAVPRLDRELNADVAVDGSADLVARFVAAQPAPPPPVVSAAPTSWDLATVLGIDDPYQFDPARWWVPRPTADQLRIPIGEQPEGSSAVLDLKEPAEDGMGPHGLVVGATGSGKSELLRTVVLALAATHSSESVNFLLIDFKGGATFTGLERLPHTGDVITNLQSDPTYADRLADTIEGEVIRRQELLRHAGKYASRRDYERARANGAPLEPLPRLIMIVDEFTELLNAKPELINHLVMIGRVGRSLGVHLLLASQRLEEGRLRGLDTHLSYRIALRTFSALESRIVLGVADAYELPRAPGHAYLRVGTDPLVRFRAGYVSGPPPRRARPATADGQVDDLTDEFATETLADVLISRMEGAGPPAHRVWLPPLDESPTFDQLLSLVDDPARGVAGDRTGWGTLQVPVGVTDKPLEQRRDLLTLDLAGAAGNVAVVGGPASGKSTLLASVVSGLALLHTPREVQVYGLDFGGGLLTRLRGLPHVGSIATRTDGDMVRRTVAQLTSLLGEREAAFNAEGVDSIGSYRRQRTDSDADPYGDVFLVIDGWDTVRRDFEELETPIATLAARGLSYGIHVVLATNRWRDVRSRTLDLIGTRLELRQSDTLDSEIDRRLAAQVPAGVPGRGLTADKLHFLSALPRTDGRSDTEDLPQVLSDWAERVRRAWRGVPAPPVRLLPAVVRPGELPTPDEPLPGLPIGLAEDDLKPVYLDIDTEPHFLVVGDAGSGKSTLLRTYAEQVARRGTPDQARILLVDYRRSLFGAVGEEHLLGYGASSQVTVEMIGQVAQVMSERLPGPDVTREQLRDRSWWTGPDCYVLIDDYDLVAETNNPLLPLRSYIPMGRDIGLHIVLARRSGGISRALYDPVITAVRELASPGLLLSGDRDEGPVLGSVRMSRQPPGRGWLVTRRYGNRLIQVAWSDPDAVRG
ncbi:MAG: type VII secretion protein EccCb [Micromonosporaceae bacterium]